MSEPVTPDLPAPGLPGGTAVSRLRVYDWPAADGLVGGSPHLHTVSREGYVVLGGHGAVQTISADGFAEAPLHPGVVLWFTPGTVHRLINGDGALDILTLMQNAGLPEAGDAVLTFPTDSLADSARYRAAALLPDTKDELALAEAARARRDLAVEGWMRLRQGIERDREGTLAELYDAALALVGERVGGWRSLWSAGPMAQASETGEQLDALQAGNTAHLLASAVHRRNAESAPERFGMCGRLTVWQLG